MPVTPTGHVPAHDSYLPDCPCLPGLGGMPGLEAGGYPKDAVEHTVAYWFCDPPPAMDIDPSELARVLQRVALAVDENTRLLSKINDLHREATELHGELCEALTDLEQLLKRIEVD
jgi:hypothetical protein